MAAETIAFRIHLVRGEKVLLDADLGDLYGVATKRLNEQVRRNPTRFPPDFMFQLTDQEFSGLRSQFATSKMHPGRGGRRYLPYAFTEHGALMAANLLTSFGHSCVFVRRSLRTKTWQESSKSLSERPKRSP